MNTSVPQFIPPPPPPPHAARNNRHRVNFFCYAPAATRVSLIGDFNEWRPEATPMLRTPTGAWIASLELPHGHHQYLFLVDKQPTLDPQAYGRARNERNEPVSLLAVS